MSLPGVESARRRRASHPSSSTPSGFSTFSFRLNQRLNTHHYTPTQRVRCCDLVAASVSVESNVQLDYDDDDDDDNDDVMRITPAMNESELISNNQRRVAIEARDRLHDKLNVGGIRGSAHRWRHQRLQQVASMTIFGNPCSTFRFLTSLLLKSKSRSPIPIRQTVSESNIEHTDNESSCPVCLDTLMLSLDNDDNHHHNNIKHQVVISLPCRHSFHQDCLLPWLSLATSAKSCPVCRAPITLAQFIPQ